MTNLVFVHSGTHTVHRHVENLQLNNFQSNMRPHGATVHFCVFSLKKLSRSSLSGIYSFNKHLNPSNSACSCFVPAHLPAQTENTSNYRGRTTSEMLFACNLEYVPLVLLPPRARLNHDSLSPALRLCDHPGW